MGQQRAKNSTAEERELLAIIVGGLSGFVGLVTTMSVVVVCFRCCRRSNLRKTEEKLRHAQTSLGILEPCSAKKEQPTEFLKKGGYLGNAKNSSGGGGGVDDDEDDVEHGEASAAAAAAAASGSCSSRRSVFKCFSSGRVTEIGSVDINDLTSIEANENNFNKEKADDKWVRHTQTSSSSYRCHSYRNDHKNHFWLDSE